MFPQSFFPLDTPSELTGTQRSFRRRAPRRFVSQPPGAPTFAPAGGSWSWDQAALATHVGVTRPSLSVIEKGKATAEIGWRRPLLLLSRNQTLRSRGLLFRHSEPCSQHPPWQELGSAEPLVLTAV